MLAPGSIWAASDQFQPALNSADRPLALMMKLTCTFAAGTLHPLQRVQSDRNARAREFLRQGRTAAAEGEAVGESAASSPISAAAERFCCYLE